MGGAADSKRVSAEATEPPSMRVRLRCQLCSDEKAARRRLFNSNLLIVDQAAVNAGFDLRR
jgi:hypothetical protein